MSYVSGVGFAGASTTVGGVNYDPEGLLSSDPSATGPGSVRFVQGALIELGALAPTAPNGKSNADGYFGPITSAAFQSVTGSPKVSGQSLLVLGTKYAAKSVGLPSGGGGGGSSGGGGTVQTCPPGTLGVPPVCVRIPVDGDGGSTPPPPDGGAKNKTLMYVGIGAGVLVVGGILFLALSKKPSAAKKAVANRRAIKSGKMKKALGYASQIAEMKRRGDYNYARFAQLQDDTFGLVGRYNEKGRPVFPSAVRRAMKP